MVDDIIWQKDNFLNKNLPFLFNKEIVEYDMAEAGFSLIKQYKLLSDEDIKELTRYDKEKRKIIIGEWQKENKNKHFSPKEALALKEGMKESFAKARCLFMLENHLETSDIITVKKDAIFTCKRCKHQKFGDYINFREKHYYSSYILLGKKLEIYYSPIDFAVKGIDDDLLKYHEEYIIKFMKLWFRKMETEDGKTVLEFLKRFCDRYKHKELEVGYYRNFNVKSNFTVQDDTFLYMQEWEVEKESLDITYNFFNVLIKLVDISL